MPRPIPTSHRRPERGSSLLEGALVLGVLIFTVIGIVDVGQVLMLHQGLTERVRAGARWAVVNAGDAAGVQNVVLYNTPTPDVGARPLLGLTPDLVTVTRSGEGTAEDRLEVRLEHYPFRFFNPLVQGLYTARPFFVVMSMEGERTSLPVAEVQQPKT
jgi:hypothetical protein